MIERKVDVERNMRSTSSRPKVSIVVLNYNSSEIWSIVSRSIDSVFRLAYRPMEIIIVDNGSNDTSPRLLEQIVTKTTPDDVDVKMIRMPRNLGFAGGNLAGFEVAGEDSEYLVLINNDVLCEEHSLGKLIDSLEEDRSVAAVQGKLLTWDGKRIDGMGCFTTQLGYSYNFGHTLRPESCCRETFVTAVGGAYAVYRISSVRECGGLFIPELFLYSEDMELGIRLWRHGFKSKSIPIVVGRHFGSATTTTTTHPHLFSLADYTEWRNRTTILVMYERIWGVNLMLGLPYALATSIVKRTGMPLIATIQGMVLGLKLKKKYRNVSKNKPREPRLVVQVLNWYAVLVKMYLKYGVRAAKLTYLTISRALNNPENYQELFEMQCPIVN